MIEWFGYLHAPIASAKGRMSISNTCFQAALLIGQDQELSLFSPELLSMSNSIDYVERLLSANIALYLAHRGLMEQSRIDRIFLEIVVLHKFKMICERWDQQVHKNTLGRVIPTLGGMTQQRLTELLFSLETDQRPKVFMFGQQSGFDVSMWEKEFLGATAVVRVIKACNHVDGVTVRLPTLEEDIDQSTDVFLEVLPSTTSASNRSFHLAVSVKSIYRPVYISLESVDPQTDIFSTSSDSETSIISTISEIEQREKIRQGAWRLSRKYAKKFYPVRVLLGRDRREDYSLFVGREEPKAIAAFLNLIEQKLIEPKLLQVAQA